MALLNFSILTIISYFEPGQKGATMGLQIQAYLLDILLSSVLPEVSDNMRQTFGTNLPNPMLFACDAFTASRCI